MRAQFITMAGEEQWQDMQLGDTFEGTAFDKSVRLTRRAAVKFKGDAERVITW